MTFPSSRRAVPALLAAGVLGVLTLGAGFREDEIQCDHAAAHLVDCCPELDPSTLQCSHAVFGCGGGNDPWLTLQESECLRDLDCGAVRSAGICDRVEARILRLEDSDETSDLGAGGGSADVEADQLDAVCP